MSGLDDIPSNLMRNSVPSAALDRIDLAIIAALQKNARLSNKELAAKVNLAPSSSLARVRKLMETKVLEGFHAEVNPGALGVSLQAIIAVRLRRHSRVKFRSLYAHIRRFVHIADLWTGRAASVHCGSAGTCEQQEFGAERISSALRWKEPHRWEGSWRPQNHNCIIGQETDARCCWPGCAHR